MLVYAAVIVCFACEDYPINATVFTIFKLLGSLWQSFKFVSLSFSENKMRKRAASREILSGTYIPSHVKQNLAWYIDR